MILTLLIFLLILSLLVFIHEAGHFFVAKKFGIKVEEFGFGLPPRLFGIKRGETIYSINWLPIGGFVKLYGEDEAGAGRVQIPSSKLKVKNEDMDRAFFARPAWQRSLVIVAGVVMNTFLAALIFYIFLFASHFKTELPLLGNHTFFGVNQVNMTAIIVQSVSANSPAEKAGIKPASHLQTINHEKITTVEKFVSTINTFKGKEVEISWEDVETHKKFTAMVLPRVSPPAHEGALGVSFYPLSTAVLSYDTLEQKIFSGFVHPINLMAYNFDVMGKLLSMSIKQKDAGPIGEGVSGPVGIYSLVGNILQIPDARERLLQILNLAGVLSISLAFFNILPIPGLDGGRFFFIMIEIITRRKVHPAFENWAHTIGIAALLGLIAIITAHDIFKLFR